MKNVAKEKPACWKHTHKDDVHKQSRSAAHQKTAMSKTIVLSILCVNAVEPGIGLYL